MKLKISRLIDQEKHRKLIIVFKKSKEIIKRLNNLLTRLGIEVDKTPVKKGYESGIDFYNKKRKYDIEIVAFSKGLVILVVRYKNRRLKNKFLDVLKKYAKLK